MPNRAKWNLEAKCFLQDGIFNGNLREHVRAIATLLFFQSDRAAFSVNSRCILGRYRLWFGNWEKIISHWQLSITNFTIIIINKLK
ncbi:MAG: hypothetical protein RMY36_000430 [Nostoc sp. SerVER01]